MYSLKDVDLNLYKIFLAVAKYGSISKAAKALYVSQPAVSYSTKLLEEQLGCQLFIRNTKGVELTADAQKLIYYVENAYNTIETGCKMLHESSDFLSGEIRIGVPTHIGIFLVSKYIQKFNSQYPGIRFIIVNKSTKEMVELLEKRNLDLIIDSYPIETKREDVTISKLIEIKNCFVGGKKYIDIAKNITKVEDLRKYQLLLPTKGTSTREKLEDTIKERVQNLEALIDVPTTEVMLDLVKRGMGIGYFSKESVVDDIKNGDLFEIPVDIELPKTEICIAYVDNLLTNAPRKFCKMIKEEIRSSELIRKKALRIILTSECTHNCFLCHKEGLDKKREIALNKEDYNYLYTIISRYFNINNIDLTGGEPLIRDDIVEIVSSLKNNGAKLTITTNGILLDDKIDIGEYIDKINVSLYALNREKYEKISDTTNTYNKIIVNLKRIRLKYPTLNIGINMTLIKGFNDDKEDIEAMIEFAKSLKVSLKIIEYFPKKRTKLLEY